MIKYQMATTVRCLPAVSLLFHCAARCLQRILTCAFSLFSRIAALVAQEYLDGDVYSEVNQPFGISHDPNSPAPTGDMSSVDPDATPTSSAYILQPPSQQATTAPATTATASPDVDSASSSVERISLQLTRPAEGAAAHEHDGDGSIEENLHQFAKDLN